MFLKWKGRISFESFKRIKMIMNNFLWSKIKWFSQEKALIFNLNVLLVGFFLMISWNADFFIIFPIKRKSWKSSNFHGIKKEGLLNENSWLKRKASKSKRLVSKKPECSWKTSWFLSKSSLNPGFSIVRNLWLSH